MDKGLVSTGAQAFNGKKTFASGMASTTGEFSGKVTSETMEVTKSFSAPNIYDKKTVDGLLDKAGAVKTVNSNSPDEKGNVNVQIEFTLAEYEALEESGEVDPNTIYCITDVGGEMQSAISNTPIGSILAYAGATVPKGFLLCNGNEYLKTDYPLLYKAIGDTYNTEETTEGYFRVPDYRGRFLEMTDDNVGTNIEAGLPNITGTATYLWAANVESLGSLSKTQTSAVKMNTGGSGFNVHINFNARNGETKTDGTLKTSSDYKVYGKSDTVQPPATVVNYIIHATNHTELPQDAIDDTVTTADNSWSAEKIDTEIKSVDNKNNYSTEEQVIGTWIDGKPIYRKVYVKSNLSYFKLGLSIDEVVTTNILVTLSNDTTIPLGYTHPTSGYMYYDVRNKSDASNSQVYFLQNVSYTFKRVVFIIEYTKTTD